MSYGLIAADTLAVRLWIAPQTFDLLRVQLVQPGAGEVTTWQVDFWDFNKVVEISPPVIQP